MSLFKLLRREVSSSGYYRIGIFADYWNDATMVLEMGKPGQNKMRFNIYDSSNKYKDFIDVKLSYRTVKKIQKTLYKAYALSKKYNGVK